MPGNQQSRFDEIKAAGQLPSPTSVALEILRLADRDDVSVTEMTRLLEADPGMVGRILKLANSSLFGPVRATTSVRDAVTRLGIRTVRNVTLCFSVLSQSHTGASRRFDHRQFWSRSVAAGIVARAASPHIRGMAADDAFTCGVLAEVGCLALAYTYPDEYDAVLLQWQQAPDIALTEYERARFATDHSELSAAMLRDWGLSDSLAVAVEQHEKQAPQISLDDSLAQRLAKLLSFAHAMASVFVAEARDLRTRAKELLSRAETSGFSVAEVAELGDRAAKEWLEWGPLLDIPARPLPAFTQILDSTPPGDSTAPRSGPDESREVEPSESRGRSPEGDKPSGITILVAENELCQQKILTRYLTGAGFTVLMASNGREAMRLILEANPPIVVTDILMPEMDGMTLCRLLRQSKLGRQVYIIVQSTLGNDQEIVAAFEAGADDYVSKPVNAKLLLARIRAGQRMLRLQEEVARDKEELRAITADLAVANRQLQQAAFTDVLTGLPNRRYALAHLAREWADSLEKDRPLACLMADIDHFKRVNDTYGHDAGDVVIRETALMLRAGLRGTDMACRLGGEEFLIVCPATNATRAVQCAERLRSKLEAHRVTFNRVELRVTLSLGAAARTPAISSPEQLLKAADLAVYTAKQSGRNRVSLAPETAGSGPN